MMARARSVLVVGAGIVGASIAWHLVRLGLRVTIVDVGTGGGLATARSFAWINASWGNPASYVRFRLRAMAGWRRLGSELQDLPQSWCGGLLWDLPAEALEAYVKEHAAWGYGIRMVDRAECARIEPNLSNPPLCAAHVAEEGAVEPAEAARMLLDAARRAGAVFVSGRRVKSLESQHGRVTGVALDDGGKLLADETVVAAGTDTARLLATAGAAIALTDPPGLIAHSTAVGARLMRGLVLTPACHMRQTRDGRLIVGADFAGAAPEGDTDAAGVGLVRTARRLLKTSDGVDFSFATVGRRPTPADGFPAVGRMQATEGLTVAVMHSGVTLAPLVGELLAEAIATGRSDPDLAAYAPDRPALMPAASNLG